MVKKAMYGGWGDFNPLRKHWLYFKRLVTHKIHVFDEGRKLGVPFWQLVLHDISKFSFSEWNPYVQRFYGDENPIVLRRFAEAVKHHHNHNPHHWNYWLRPTRARWSIEISETEAKLLHFDKPFLTMSTSNADTINELHQRLSRQAEPMEMPMRYRMEMLADWLAVGRDHDAPPEYALISARSWYIESKQENRIILAPDTQAWIETKLGV